MRKYDGEKISQMRYLSLTVMVLVIMVSAGLGVSAARAETDMASNYLYDYALKLYKGGSNYDAIHELKKCLMVNPDNRVARILLRKISPGIGLEASTPFGLLVAGDSLACPGQEVVFRAGAPSLYGRNSFIYVWDFGDGTVSEGGSKIAHIYHEGGRYLVRVAVNDQSRSPEYIAIKETWIGVNSPAVAGVKFDPVCCAGREIVFDASSTQDPDGDGLSYYWDFGDGTTVQGQRVSHAFVKPAEYAVTLSVNDGSGTPCGRSTVTLPVLIGGNPVAIMDIQGRE